MMKIKYSPIVTIFLLLFINGNINVQVMPFGMLQNGNVLSDVGKSTGGSVTDLTVNGIDYRIHTFTTSGNFMVTDGVEVEYLGGSGIVVIK